MTFVTKKNATQIRLGHGVKLLRGNVLLNSKNLHRK